MITGAWGFLWSFIGIIFVAFRHQLARLWGRVVSIAYLIGGLALGLLIILLFETNRENITTSYIVDVAIMISADITWVLGAYAMFYVGQVSKEQSIMQQKSIKEEI